MNKTYLSGAGIVAGLLLATAPFFASAATLEDLQAQLKSLLSQIAQVQASASIQSSTSASGGVASPVSYRVCNVLSRSLSFGSRGDDVASLQEFLNAQGYLSANASGYFGSLTGAAVAKWQSSQHITAAGVFGPLSRAHLKTWCGNDGNTVTSQLQASPLSGAAPLAVTFTPNVQIRFPSGDLGSYQIDFGDGQNQMLTCSTSPSATPGSCTPLPVTHTYQSNGTFTAVLETTPGNINPAGFTPNVVGKVQIVVGSVSGKGTVSAVPQTGAAPLPVSFTYVPITENGTYHIDYGDGSSEQMSTKQIECFTTPCINPAVSNHTYAASGTYTVVVSPYVACMYSNPRCMIAVMPLAQTVVTVTDGTSNGAPVISGISGPTILAIGATGTWSVQASDPANGTLSYSITWGDENQTPIAMNAAASTASFVQTSTFTHSYAAAGTYTVTVIVRDTQGLTAQTSSTVQVGGGVTVCTQEYSPVCGQPPGPVCAAGQMCPMYMLAPKTYGNMCELNAAGAKLLNSGTCANGL